MSWLLQPYAEARSYRAIAYLLLGLPLGIFDFVVVVTGLSLGLGLSVTLLGIPVLVGTLLLVRAIAALERRLAWSLVDAPMPRLGHDRELERGLFWVRLRSLVASPRMGSELAFVLLRLPLGVLGFAVVASLLYLSVGGFALPIEVAFGVSERIGSWTIDTFPESLAFVPVSIVFLLVGPRLLLAYAQLPRTVATSLLGRVDPRALKLAVADVLERRGEADAFGILDDLELRLGRGSFLTPTRLEAALLALESTGRLHARRQGSRTVYALA